MYTYDARYEEIVPDQSTIYSYIVNLNERRISVSGDDSGVHARWRRHAADLYQAGVFLDGGDKPEIREHGAKALLDKLMRSQ